MTDPRPRPGSPGFERLAAIERAASAAAAGLSERLDRDAADGLARAIRDDPEPTVRAAALGALVRHARAHPGASAAAWSVAAGDDDAAVRRRAAQVASEPGVADGEHLVTLLTDPDGLVAEAAAFALGELGQAAARAGALPALAEVARRHDDPLVRESAVAALGSLGRAEGLEAVLAALGDRPQVRRRAVIALAAFEGEEVEAALRGALEDRDWQVRQAAEDLLGEDA